MVAGMTPCTADGDFVAAVMNAGYHVELAGGAHYNERALRQKIDYIVEKVAPGQGITVNVLFINQKQWGFQFPLAQVLRNEGVPIEGFTVAAGIPSLEMANEIISALRGAGIGHVSFKPGSVEGILQVVNIARHNKECPIVIQWTGGRAGGHHSFEDFHQPILDTYSAIRSCDNIILVGGSGFGDGAETFPYLDGSWSLAHQYPLMPFDGLLLGSRVMVALEGKASRAVKETIAAAAGVLDEKEWVRSYKAPVGGVVTVISELGEPIHKIATRGVMLWKELDETVFKLSRDKRAEYLRANRLRIMQRLNDDFQKVWFGKKSDGSLADLHEMTYEEVLRRLADLLFVKHQDRWIDKSYRALFVDVVRRAEERLARGVKGVSLVAAALSANPNVNPHAYLDQLTQTKGSFLVHQTQLMSSEDCLYFVSLCRRPGQKPVPFIPVLDADFETWFKKDSLWQSEDVDAVVDQDPQRVCILQGPVAVKHSKLVDEPVKKILDDIVNHHIELILNGAYGGSVSSVPSTTWFGVAPPVVTAAVPDFIHINRNSAGKVMTVTEEGKALPAMGEWIGWLTDNKQSWLSALLLSEHLLQGKRIVTNTVKTLFAPKLGWIYKVSADRVEVFDSSIRAVVQASVRDRKQISIDVLYHGSSSSSKLSLCFEYDPRNARFPIHEVLRDRIRRIKEFYWSLWFPKEPVQAFTAVLGQDPLHAVFSSSSTASPQDISTFCRVVGNNAAAYARTASEHCAPMDFAIVVAWESVIKCLFPEKVDGDLLKLVHLSNKISYIGYCEPISAWDAISSEAEITSIKWTPSGKIVEVEAISKRAGEPILRVVSKFMYRGEFSKYGLYFEKSKELSKALVIGSSEDLAVFMSKPWIQLTPGAEIKIGSRLMFKLEYFHQQDVSRSTLNAIQCSGRIMLKTDTKEYLLVGNVSFTATSPMKENPVLHYLDRKSKSLALEEPTMFEGEGIQLTPGMDQSLQDLRVTTSSSNQNYSDVSGDHNPIHTSALIADLVGLPGTITHGMWTSAAVRSLVETYGAENQPLRVRSYDVSFDGMVLPMDKLQTRLAHVGMHQGRKLVRIETVNQHGEKVLHGLAEIDQPRTAYVFTGQGSQEPKMGMDLYESSAVAKAIWDQADEHFFSKYGFSILDIVRNNPKTLTVYFGGPGGQAIRRNYESMVYERTEGDGAVRVASLFPQINEDSVSHTFTSPNGLLFATQFTQPALTLMEMAAYEDMKNRGLAGPGSVFAGHSLGEYAALAAVGEVLSIETLCDIVFYRGLTMQVAVARDEHGRSDYGMVAVNPGRVGPSFDDKLLRMMVPQIAAATQRLLEIVNYNVENWQYVVAGDLVALETLSKVLSLLSKQRVDLGKLVKEIGLEKMREKLEGIVLEVYADAAARRASGLLMELERGVATIPLVGIDVPFHSSFLLGGVASFRKCLEEKIRTVNVDASILRNRYIPNLTGVPFETNLEYIKRVLTCCDSQVLREIADNWSETKIATAADVQVLARTILIELLAFQFASPVRWIETQDVILKTFSIERLIEIGPSPVLVGMAERTLKIKYQEYDDALNQTRILWSYSKNRSEINYENFPKESAAVSSVETSLQAAPAPAAAAPATALPAAVAVSAPSGPPSKRYE